MLILMSLLTAVATEPQMSVMTAVRAAMESAMGNGNQSSGQATILPKEAMIMGPWAPNPISMDQVPRPMQTQPVQHQLQQHQVQQPQQPQPGNNYPPYYNQPAPQSPPYMPHDNYYLPPANNYGPPPTTEFRSEQYTYPIEPPIAYPLSQPTVDPSLVPTARHFVIVSFIGLLLLFAVIQNSIAAAKRKDALVEVLSNRRKRQLDETLALLE